MLPDGIKSMVFKSFITCDDPKGVIDCTTIKKSKITAQKMEQKIKTHRSKYSSKSLESTAENEEPISREMSMRERFDRKSEKLVEDILEEAFDLQESLIMLGNLQDASKQLIPLKNEKYHRSSSYELRDQSFPVEFQGSQLLYSSGSFRNGADDVKKMIKDSLLRRNVMRNAMVSERTCFREMNSDSGSEIPSTSSSQSSMVSDSVNCCLVSTSSQKSLKGTSTNLIAKLMGLEELPSRDSKAMHTAQNKEFEFEKIPGNARISKSLINKEDPEKETEHGLRHVPPIVLIRPMHPRQNELEYRARVCPGEEAFNRRVMLRKMKMEEPHPFNESDSHGGMLSSIRLHRKQEAKGVPLKQIANKDTGLRHKEEVWKSKKSVVNTKRKAAEKLKTSTPIHTMPREKEPIDKKVITLKKVSAANRKPLEEETKAEIASRPQGQEKVTSNRKKKIHKLHSSAPDSESKQAVQTKFNNLNRRKREKTCIAEGRKEDGSIDTNGSADNLIDPNNTTHGAVNTVENETDECKIKIIECCNESLNSLSRVSPWSPTLEVDANPIIHSETDIQCWNQGINLKAWLLSRSSFLNRAEELFGINLNSGTKLQASNCENTETPSSKPFIDCAIALLEGKYHQNLQVGPCLSLGYVRNPKMEISVGKLVEEVCSKIERLMSYRTTGENLFIDSLYAMLAKDLNSKEMMNETWDFGWEIGFSGKEGEKVVNDIEQLILSGLVDEFFIEIQQNHVNFSL